MVGGYQYLNNNQVLINNIDLSEGSSCFKIQSTFTCDGINENILKLPDGQSLFIEKPLEPVLNYFNGYFEHLQFHNEIKDFSCKFCIEIMNFYVSPQGQFLCNYFGF